MAGYIFMSNFLLGKVAIIYKFLKSYPYFFMSLPRKIGHFFATIILLKGA